MENISYALRDNPDSFYMLTDGGETFSNVFQIAIIRNKLLYPDFYNELLFLDPLKQKIQKRDGIKAVIDKHNKKNYLKYAAKIDSQLEVKLNDTLLRSLKQDYIPLIEDYSDCYNDQASAVLVILKVYLIESDIKEEFFEKGNKGSASIIKLYDQYEDEVTLPVKVISPLFSDNKFNYLKDELIHLLKVENGLLCIYDNTDKGIEALQERVDAERKLNRAERGEYSYDYSSPRDMAQKDYDSVFSEVKKLAPQMGPILEYIREIVPAQMGEADKLFGLIRKNESKKGDYRERLIEIQLRSAVNNALFYSKRYNCDIEDAFQEAVIGIITAVDKYNKEASTIYGSYAAIWMRQMIERYMPIGEANFRIPIHYKQPIMPLVAFMEHLAPEYYGSEEDIIDEICEKFGCSRYEAKEYYYVLAKPISYEEMFMETHPLYSQKLDPLSIEDEIEQLEVKKIVRNAVEKLPPKIIKIITLRFGLDDGCEHTLEEIGQELGVTRERVRQLEKKGLQSLEISLERQL